MQIDEIMKGEVDVAKQIFKKSGKLLCQFNLYKGRNVVPIIMQLEKEDWVVPLIKHIVIFKPDAVSFISEGWMSQYNKEEGEKLGLNKDVKLQDIRVTQPSKDPNRSTVVTVLVWTKTEKRSFIGRATETNNLEPLDVEDDNLQFQSRWDWIQKAMNETDKISEYIARAREDENG